MGRIAFALAIASSGCHLVFALDDKAVVCPGQRMGQAMSGTVGTAGRGGGAAGVTNANQVSPSPTP